jgi:hypothetical protein
MGSLTSRRQVVIHPDPLQVAQRERVPSGAWSGMGGD